MLEDIKRIVREAGKIMLQADAIENEIESKQGSANFVTKYDKEVQDFLFDQLSALFPDAGFLGEEDLNKGDLKNSSCFIIDPIDGTTNFIFDYKYSAISVAYRKDQEIYAGVVYNPYLDELFYAQKGNGAFLNEKQLTIKNVALKDGIVGFGSTPYYRDKSKATFALVETLFANALDIRRSGSAALDLCSVAANRFTMFFEVLLSPWDYAAASLIIEEAGGKVSTMERTKLPHLAPCSVIAANPVVYEEFFQLKNNLIQT